MPTFVHPWALWGMALASAPIIIHLLNRRRFKVMEWAAMEFLLASNRRNYRRLRIEQLLLLLLRVLLIVVLVFIIARPTVQSRAVAGLAERSRFVILVLDNSMSMGLREGSSSAYDRAVVFSEQLMSSLREGDTWVVLTTDGGREAVRVEPSFELEAARAAVARDRVPLSDGGGDLLAALERAEEALEAAGGVEAELYIVTDMQQAAWTAEAGAASDEDVERLTALCKRAGTVVVDVGMESPANLAVTAVSLDRRTVVAGTEVVVRARAANFGPADAPDVSAGFLVDGFRQQQSPPASLLPGGAAQWEFRHIFPSVGSHVVTVELVADALERDNRRTLCVEARENVLILCVDGEPGDGMGGEVSFLRRALRPGAEDSEDRLSLFRVETVTLEALTPSVLPRYDAVALANVASLEAAATEAVERYVREGGTLVVFLGDQVDAAFYNAEAKGLFPCRIAGEWTGSDDQKAIHVSDELDDHPFTRLFREQDRIRLSSPFFFRAARLEAAEDARVVCRFANGAPFLVEGRHGEGRVVVFASTADDEWNDMPSWPAYLGLMQEVFADAARDPALSRNVSVGEPLVRHLPPALAGRTVSILRPGGGEPVRVAPTSAGGLVAVIYEDTGRAGIYELTVDAGENDDVLARQEDRFAVNVSAAESDVRRISIDAVRRMFPGAEMDYQRGGRQRTQNGVAGDRGEIWRTLAYALLAMVLLESILAQRFSQ
ncbi:BatA domain-containing protein [bacterium]|nr:BatA domain-containing protein [bacterium]